MKSLNTRGTEISILYVEDETDAREMIKSALWRKFPALRLHTAENGKAGLALFKEFSPDIVLTDINMPVMDGIRMANEIRALNPAAIIVVLTAHSDTRYLLEAIKIGISRYVLKPIDHEKLFEAIEECVDRISLERQIEEQNEFIRKLSRAVEQSPSSIVITDTEGVIEYVNPKFTEITGYTPEEVIGQNPRVLKTGITPPETYVKLWSTITAGFEWRGEFLNRKKNGEFYWEAASISPVFNGEGGITHFVAVKDDITDKKLMEEALRESEARYRSFFENSIDGVLLTSPDGSVSEANPAACRVFGRTTEEICRAGRTGLMDESDPRLDAAVEELAATGAFKGELTAIRSDGTTFPLEISSSAYLDRNGQKCSSIIVRDISERKEAEREIEILNTNLAARACELEAANRELESFGYSVSHDLRKPLTNINGYCQVILQLFGDSLNEQCKKFVQEIYNGTLKMNQLINTLLDFSRLTRREIHWETVDLSELAGTIAAGLRVAGPERRVTFTIAQGIEVKGDAKLLRIVLDNLFGNAWKYTGKKEDGVIEFGVCDREGKPAYFVRDNGAGFDMTQAGRLFEAFQRLHSDSEFEGFGIGLATVQRVIQRHGGRVWAEGEVDRGATFYFTLPHEA